MKASVRKQFTRLGFASGSAFLAAVLAGGVWAQESQPQSGAEAAREKKNEKVDTARDKIQGARDSAQEARQDARGTVREDRRDIRDARETAGDKIGDARRDARGQVRDARQEAGSTIRDDRHATRDARETARDTVRDDREQIREARREARQARREFIADRLRSGDFGLFFRRLADRLQVSDIAGSGAIAQSGLKEGDEIVSVNGKPVHSEREFVDTMFADHESNKPAQVVVMRNGQQQTLSINTKPFVEEHMNGDNRLEDFGLVLDQSDPNHVKVQSVTPRSPAFYGGMQSGDVITRFNGQRINAVKDLIQTIAGLTNNTTSVEVNRNGGSRSLDIEVPGNQQDEARTALKPTLPNTGAAPAPQPQGNFNRAPQLQGQPQSQPNLPRQ
jgi:C-terminal processing protease CtpA/Prc